MFRSVVVVPYKGKEAECWNHNEALIYLGPFSKVTDEDGNTFLCGGRIAVCGKSYEICSKEPCADYFKGITPREQVIDPESFACTGGVVRRHSCQSKIAEYDTTITADKCCEPSGSCLLTNSCSLEKSANKIGGTECIDHPYFCVSSFYLFLIRSSTTLGSARVDVSPMESVSSLAILRRIRRMIFPDLVFGRPGAQ